MSIKCIDGLKNIMPIKALWCLRRESIELISSSLNLMVLLLLLPWVTLFSHIYHPQNSAVTLTMKDATVFLGPLHGIETFVDCSTNMVVAPYYLTRYIKNCILQQQKPLQCHQRVWWDLEFSYFCKREYEISSPITLFVKMCPITPSTMGCSCPMISGCSSITVRSVSIVFSKPIAVMAFSSDPSSVSRTWLNVCA